MSASASVSDVAGNSTSATSPTVKIDRTAPTLSPVITPKVVLFGQKATIAPGAADTGGSGLASASCQALDTTSVGAKTTTCTATDVAGNVTTATVRYTVAYPAAKVFLQDTLATCRAMPGLNKADTAILNKAIANMTAALSTNRWVDPAHVKSTTGSSVFDSNKYAAGNFRDLLTRHTGPIPTAIVQSCIFNLVQISRILAVTAIGESAKPSKVALANTQITAGDQAGVANPTSAIDRYKSAWSIVTHK